MTENLRRFVDALPPWRDDDPRAAPHGQAFRTAAEQLGVPCPDALVELGDAMATRQVWRDSWELLTPDDALETRAFLRRESVAAPCLAPRAEMLPLFVRDGDLLLLDKQGAIRLFSFSGAEYDHGVVAGSFDALLGRLLDGAAIEASGGATGVFLWVDDVEYLCSVVHVHEDGGCHTAFRCDLAPHVHRRAGRHELEVVYPEQTLTAPREAPVGLVATAGGTIDLRQPETAARLIRLGRARGWTGRDGPLRIEG